MIVLVMGALMSYMTVARKKKAASVETNSGRNKKISEMEIVEWAKKEIGG